MRRFTLPNLFLTVEGQDRQLEEICPGIYEYTGECELGWERDGMGKGWDGKEEHVRGTISRMVKERDGREGNHMEKRKGER